MINGKKVLIYNSSFPPSPPSKTSCWSLGPDFDQNYCMSCDSRCGQLMCGKCIHENMTESVTNGGTTTTLTINKQTVQIFDYEIICDEFNG